VQRLANDPEITVREKEAGEGQIAYLCLDEYPRRTQDFSMRLKSRPVWLSHFSLFRIFTLRFSP